MTFPERLKKLRKEKNIYQLELANFIGVSRPTITQYESGDRRPDHDTLKNIANYFNVSVDYLLGNTDERSPADKIIQKDKEKNVEVKELLDRFNVQLEGEELTEQDKEAVIDVLRMLKKRHDNENN